MLKRPLFLTLFGWLLILGGAAGFIFHFPKHHSWQSEDAWLLVLELVLLVAGVFILRGRNWARWLALAWIAFHVAISFYNSLRQVAIHTLILLVFAWILFCPAARAWFRSRSRSSEPA